MTGALSFPGKINPVNHMFAFPYNEPESGEIPEIVTPEEFSMTDIAPTVSRTLGLPPPARATGSAIRQVVQDLAGCDRVAMLAPDALGEFAWLLWKDNMPWLSSLHAERSIVLHSVMPSITPVNFACMVSGAAMSIHGVGVKTESFQCETLFDLVREAGGKSAGIGLTGYTGDQLLGRYADIWGNAGEGDDDDVANKVLETVDEEAPEFLIAQFGMVDTFFHKYGPSSVEMVPVLRDTDARLRRVTEHLKAHAYGVILLADHGQHDQEDAGKNEEKGAHGTDSPADSRVPCTWI